MIGEFLGAEGNKGLELAVENGQETSWKTINPALGILLGEHSCEWIGVGSRLIESEPACATAKEWCERYDTRVSVD